MKLEENVKRSSLRFGCDGIFCSVDYSHKMKEIITSTRLVTLYWTREHRI